MNIQLIKGSFTANEALEIISQMIQVKIRFHENKIGTIKNEEDIKNRESKIKQLQHDLARIRQYIESHGNRIAVQSEISLTD